MGHPSRRLFRSLARIAFQRFEQRAEIVAWQIGVHDRDGAGCTDPLPQLGNGFAHGDERIVPFGRSVIGDDDRLWRRREGRCLRCEAKERDGGGETRRLDVELRL